MADQDVFLQRALIQEGLVDHEQLEAARRYGVEHDVDLVDALVGTETLTSRQVALIKADICEVPYVELTDYETSPSSDEIAKLWAYLDDRLDRICQPEAMQPLYSLGPAHGRVLKAH